jgi:4-azaleucine resistance transporter AzlC
MRPALGLPQVQICALRRTAAHGGQGPRRDNKHGGEEAFMGGKGRRIWRDMSRGAAANLPVALSVAAYGGVLGVLAARQGVSWGVLLAMNLSIFAGSAQFVMVDMWLPPLPLAAIVIGVLAINLRYLLIGASLQPLFQHRPLWQKALCMHFVADENWAVTMAAHRRGRASLGFLVGGGLCLLTVWCAGTLAGHGLGAVIRNPAALGLDFAFVAVFTALAMSFWRGRHDLIPWLVAAVLALASERLLPGKWYIVIGGLGGALVGAALAVASNRRPASDAPPGKVAP